MFCSESCEHAQYLPCAVQQQTTTTISGPTAHYPQQQTMPTSQGYSNFPNYAYCPDALGGVQRKDDSCIGTCFVTERPEGLSIDCNVPLPSTFNLDGFNITPAVRLQNSPIATQNIPNYMQQPATCNTNNNNSNNYVTTPTLLPTAASLPASRDICNSAVPQFQQQQQQQLQQQQQQNCACFVPQQQQQSQYHGNMPELNASRQQKQQQYYQQQQYAGSYLPAQQQQQQQQRQPMQVECECDSSLDDCTCLPPINQMQQQHQQMRQQQQQMPLEQQQYNMLPLSQQMEQQQQQQRTQFYNNDYSSSRCHKSNNLNLHTLLPTAQQQQQQQHLQPIQQQLPTSSQQQQLMPIQQQQQQQPSAMSCSCAEYNLTTKSDPICGGTDINSMQPISMALCHGTPNLLDLSIMLSRQVRQLQQQQQQHQQQQSEQQQQQQQPCSNLQISKFNSNNIRNNNNSSQNNFTSFLKSGCPTCSCWHFPRCANWFWHPGMGFLRINSENNQCKNQRRVN